jgi:hypothetical protein
MPGLIDGFVDFENVRAPAFDGGVAGAVGTDRDVLDGECPGELPERTRRTRRSNPET